MTPRSYIGMGTHLLYTSVPSNKTKYIPIPKDLYIYILLLYILLLYNII